MKMRVVAILVIVTALALAYFILRYPSPQPPVRPERMPPTKQPQINTPREAVVNYLQSLGKNDYRGAYQLLSTDSQKAHPYEEFESLCKKGGTTDYDLASAKEQEGEGGSVVVTVSLAEDPAEAGFTTILEGKAWKVVFIKGAPWFPYP